MLSALFFIILFTVYCPQLAGMSYAECISTVYFLLLQLPRPLSGTIWDCYDMTCWGRGPSANITIACDNSFNYCAIGFGGYPQCNLDDSYHHDGQGVRCYGKYTCGADSYGRAVCTNQDYRQVALFIVVAGLVVAGLLMGCCCYGRWRNIRDGYPTICANCCECCCKKQGEDAEEEEVDNTSEYTELINWLERKRQKRPRLQSVMYSSI